MYTNRKNQLSLINHALELYPDVHAPENPTSYDANNRRANILDIMLWKNVEVINPNTFNELTSKYLPVLFRITKNRENTPSEMNNYRNAN